MLTLEQIAKAAETAADLIESEGWFRLGGKGVSIFPVNGSRKCYCPLTAFPIPGVQGVVEEFARWLGWDSEQGISASEYVTSWNDNHDSAEPVIAALRSFANEIRQKDSIDA